MPNGTPPSEEIIPGAWGTRPSPPADSGFDWNLINKALAAGIPPLGLLTGGAGAWEPPSFQWGQEPIEGAQLNYTALAKFGIMPGDSTELMRAKIEAYIDSQPAAPEDEAEKRITYDTVSEGGWLYMVAYEDGKLVDKQPLGRETTTGEPIAYPQPAGPAPTDPYGRTATWVDRLGQWDYPPGWGRDPVTQEAGYAPPGTAPQWRPGELELQQQQLAQEQQNYLAQMAAQPKSWLEYSAASGQPAAVQPWMLPLMPQQYPELAGLQAGQPIPGWPSQLGTLGGTQLPTTGMPTDGGAPTTGTQPTIGMQPGGGGVPGTAEQYVAMGADPEEAARYAAIDALRQQWEQFPETKPEYPSLYLGTRFAEQQKTRTRYQEALTTAESGVPRLEDLNVSGKFDLVEQLIRQGMDRTLAERQVFGGSKTFAPYTPISDIRGEVPSAPREPTPKKKAPSVPISIPMEESMGNVRAYIPGMSWHDVNLWGTKQEGLQATIRDEPTDSIRQRFKGIATTTPSPKEITSQPASATRGGGPGGFPVRGLTAPPIQPADLLPQIPTEGFESPTRDTTPVPYPWSAPGGVPVPSGVRLSGEPRRDTTPVPYPWSAPGGVPVPQGLETQPPWAGHFLGYNPNLPLGNMPALTRPSRQYQARMGPTALQQYGAYTQARTGVTPEELQFRLWSMAPPGGGFGGLRYTR